MLQSNVIKARKERQNAKSFSALITTPATGQFQMPQSGRIKLVARTSKLAGVTAATIVGAFPTYSEVNGVVVRGAIADKTIKTPVLAAGEGVIIDGLVGRSKVTPASGFDCYVDIGLNRWRKIASIA